MSINLILIYCFDYWLSDNKTIKIIGIDEKVEDENSKILASVS